MTRAYYEREGDRYVPTDYVTGPWDPEMSHAGPPAGLVIGAIVDSAPDMGITRVTFEIPRGIPKVPCRVSVEELRGGRKVRFVRATLQSADGADLMTAHAWMMRTREGSVPVSDPVPLDLPPPDACEPFGIDFGSPGYMDGVEMRRARGTPFGAGPAAIWIRQVMPLVDGEAADPYTRCGVFGDLGNGISAMEPLSDLLAINTDLTLYLSRRPTSEWMAMSSVTVSHGMGLGMTDSMVYDAAGFVGKANQSIFIDRR